jgi:hypothetical protein
LKNKEAEIIESNFLKRIVSLVLQRLARSSEGWSGGILNGVVNIFTFVENRKLCGNFIYTPIGTKITKETSVAQNSSKTPQLTELSSQILSQLVDNNVSNNPIYKEDEKILTHVRKYDRIIQSTDEYEILAFIIELMGSIRKTHISTRTGTGGTATMGEEKRVLKIGLQIVLACLKVCYHLQPFIVGLFCYICIFFHLYVVSLTYAFSWSAFLCRIRFCDTLVIIFLK